MSMEIEKSVYAWGERYPAPAKLNLMLRIVGRREDGYHLLQTVFQFVTWSDWLTFWPHDANDVVLEEGISGVAQADNLIVRAANLLKQETGYVGGARIRLEKNLPMGGGLGGGSSDAATTLVVLNQLWALNLPQEKLMSLALSLGADVPVFVFGKAAWAEGVGEKLSEIILSEQWVVIIKPDCHVNTGEIFSAKELTRDSKTITIDEFNAGQANNDCLDVVCKHYEAIEKALCDLNVFSEARLTGTGACVFALFDSEELAIEAALTLKDKWQTYLTKSCNKSPLFS
ncbi:MAG TPA: 4-(cytidine 5'-diphospho)-2-C-methyl-D-erythritol kinase [Methylococcaceae bacterium]|nr:4-(cytidine 5'-diphospho)-2-C-methyl-D-erythritol kinase [Methylococcaceae bacterium]